MNKKNKTRLVDLKLKQLKEKHPTFPEHAIPQPKYSDKTANKLTAAIIDFLQLSGWQAERISSTGRFIDNTKVVTDVVGFQRTIGSGKWIPGSSTKGTADISATIQGRSIKIEVKIGKDSQSEYQRGYEEAIKKAGGVYIIAKNFDDFITWYDEFISISK